MCSVTCGFTGGKFQSRFGVESNGHSLNGFNAELTIAERLQEVGYMTAQLASGILAQLQRSLTTDSTCF